MPKDKYADHFSSSETPAAPAPAPAGGLLTSALPPPAPAAGVEDAPKPEPKAEVEDVPTCHYCGCPMVQHPDRGTVKDGCWHAEGGCCFLPGRRELRPGHPPCDTYTKQTAE